MFILSNETTVNVTTATQSDTTKTTATAEINYPCDYVREETVITLSIMVIFAIGVVAGILTGQSLLSKWIM